MRSMPKELWWTCGLCGNSALGESRPTQCHPKCAGGDWLLMSEQKAYKVGEEDWIHPNGEDRKRKEQNDEPCGNCGNVTEDDGWCESCNHTTE